MVETKSCIYHWKLWLPQLFFIWKKKSIFTKKGNTAVRTTTEMNKSHASVSVNLGKDRPCVVFVTTSIRDSDFSQALLKMYEENYVKPKIFASIKLKKSSASIEIRGKLKQFHRSLLICSNISHTAWSAINILWTNTQAGVKTSQDRRQSIFPFINIKIAVDGWIHCPKFSFSIFREGKWKRAILAQMQWYTYTKRRSEME